MSGQISFPTIRDWAGRVAESPRNPADSRTLTSTRLAQTPLPYLRHMLRVSVIPDEMRAAELIDNLRPQYLRNFDQIPMHSRDHVRQAKLIAPYLADQSVAFMGDSDCTSLLLGLLSKRG